MKYYSVKYGTTRQTSNYYKVSFGADGIDYILANENNLEPDTIIYEPLDDDLSGFMICILNPSEHTKHLHSIGRLGIALTYENWKPIKYHAKNLEGARGHGFTALNFHPKWSIKDNYIYRVHSSDELLFIKFITGNLVSYNNLPPKFTSSYNGFEPSRQYKRHATVRYRFNLCAYNGGDFRERCYHTNCAPFSVNY